jgi:predicted amidohydrolase
MLVAASLIERDGHAIYNTGVLIGRSGEIIGKYHKTHPTISECLLGNITPGRDLPVFDTEIGRVGYMICFDNHYPEVAHILALKGAQIIVFSNMSDGREGGELWEPYIRTRALDGGVHIVAAVNGKGTCIVSPRGEIVAKAASKPGAITRAECDLGISVRNYSKREIGKRYFMLRRFDLFEPLTKPYWDYQPVSDSRE